MFDFINYTREGEQHKAHCEPQSLESTRTLTEKHSSIQ